jgi:3-oxoadipate enol-lactonase
MPTATINGLKLNYELLGDSGSPLVLMHGYTGDITDWRNQLPAFNPSFRILALDLRGHGASGGPADHAAYTIDHFRDDVEALIDDLGFDRYHLVGHSMGGAISQEIALQSPERLLSLTLHDTTDEFSAASNNSVFQMYRDYRFNLAETQGMLAVSRIKPPFPAPPHMPAERIAETDIRLSKMSVDAFIGAWNGLAAWPGTRGERSASIKAPTLVIYGDLDTEFLIRGSKRLAENIPNAELAVIPQTAHSPQWERPDLFNAALGAFLNKISGEH